MQITYITCDSEYGLAYIGLGPKSRAGRKNSVAKTTSPAPNVNFDYDKDGNLVGIEVY